MTRVKQQRKLTDQIEFEKTPKKQERLADPDSYESRKQRAMIKKKKHQSVEQKRNNAGATQSAKERDTEAGRRGARQGGRLADKIRQLNAKKEQSEDSAEQES